MLISEGSDFHSYFRVCHVVSQLHLLVVSHHAPFMRIEAQLCMVHSNLSPGVAEHFVHELGVGVCQIYSRAVNQIERSGCPFQSCDRYTIN